MSQLNSTTPAPTTVERAVKRNGTSITAKVIVWAFVLCAAVLSAHDLVHLVEGWGAYRPASFLAPVFIDGVAWLGKLMRSRALQRGTNLLGLVYLAAGGSVSLAGNILAGENLGMKVLGGLAVTSFVLGEIALDKIEPRPIVVEVPVIESEPTSGRTCQPGCTCGRHNRKPATRKATTVTRSTRPRTPKAPAPAAAPVSPATVSEIEQALSA